VSVIKSKAAVVVSLCHVLIACGIQQEAVKKKKNEYIGSV
jgi:hypothetical protein